VIRDRYELLDVVGSGGQGDVWLALDHQHDRRVAIKRRQVRSDADRQAILSEARIPSEDHYLDLTSFGMSRVSRRHHSLRFARWSNRHRREVGC